MKKTFVALILVPPILLAMASFAFAAELPQADNLGAHAFVVDSIATSLVTAVTPDILGMRAAPMGAVIPNFAAILSLDSYRMNVASTELVAFAESIYADLLNLEPKTSVNERRMRGSATAAAQRTRAVRSRTT